MSGHLLPVGWYVQRCTRPPPEEIDGQFRWVSVRQAGPAERNQVSSANLAIVRALRRLVEIEEGFEEITVRVGTGAGRRQLRAVSVDADRPVVSAVGARRDLDASTAAAAIPRLGRADEVADAVLWLCSTNASYVTGVALPVDGGLAAG